MCGQCSYGAVCRIICVLLFLCLGIPFRACLYYLVYASRGLDYRVSSLAPVLVERSAELLHGSLLSPIRKGVLVPSGFRRSIRFHGNLYKHICDTYSVLHLNEGEHAFKTVIYHYT